MTLICFDLDGTLLDPLEGIYLSLRSACGAQGIPCPSRDDIRPRIGLDLAPLFPGLQGDSRRLEALMDGFREQFSEEGLFAQRAQDGVHLMLARLKRQGHHLVLLSSQPGLQARRALHHFDLNLIFDEVVEPLPREGWQPKRTLLDAIARDGVLGSGGLLIGDRADDIEGGRAHGLRPVGVTYGYGDRSELGGAGACELVDSVSGLDAWLGAVLDAREIHDPFSRSE